MNPPIFSYNETTIRAIKIALRDLQNRFMGEDSEDEAFVLRETIVIWRLLNTGVKK